LITEGAIIVQYIGDQRPETGLAPSAGTPERRRLQEWLHFIATELQKGLGPINNPKANDASPEPRSMSPIPSRCPRLTPCGLWKTSF